VGRRRVGVKNNGAAASGVITHSSTASVEVGLDALQAAEATLLAHCIDWPNRALAILNSIAFATRSFGVNRVRLGNKRWDVMVSSAWALKGLTGVDGERKFGFEAGLGGIGVEGDSGREGFGGRLGGGGRGQRAWG
jgi:hypothetical protein